MRSKYNTLIAALLPALLHVACTKLVEVDPPVTTVAEANVYNNDATAIAVLTGIYTQISTAYFPGGGISTLSLFPSLSADELTLMPGTSKQDYYAYYTNSLSDVNTGGTDYWNTFYPKIFVLNAAVEGLTAANGITGAVKKQLLGEAKFMRAFCYFYLVNLYGDVPLVLSTDYTSTAQLSRAPQAQVWHQVISDLKDATMLLSDEFLDISLLNPGGERVRPTKWAALALLARSYLFTKDWAGAASAAGAVISESARFSLTGLNEVFLANSSEAIWQLQPVNSGENTQDARLFIVLPSGPDDDHPVYLSPQLLGGFEAGDQRRKNWVDSVVADGYGTIYYPFKYKVAAASTDIPVTEYEMVMRLAEQYLIRAEARARQGELAEAVSDLNLIRNRAGLPDIAPGSQDGVLAAILKERRVELFTEWANRWLDLKRTGTINSVMETVAGEKGGDWSAFKQLYPIPSTEVQSGIHLIQNDGY